MIVVPDASVILKWVLEKASEPDQVQARSLQGAILSGRVEVRLPTLWHFEVGNVLGLKQPKLAKELLGVLLAFDFEEISLDKAYAEHIFDHMKEVNGVTFYDSAYHVLALRMKGLYLTADQAYVKKAKKRGHVTLLSEWEPL
ncbi:MAG: type II toxin-antitoxin system VapC family toxin [Nitrospirota bacterium]|nr:type II toxin-antitoxin system VapC family toxin [Nitrospirota bacterium]